MEAIENAGLSVKKAGLCESASGAPEPPDRNPPCPRWVDITLSDCPAAGKVPTIKRQPRGVAEYDLKFDLGIL